MLELALDHEGDLKKKYRKTWNDPKYKFYISSYWADDIKLSNNNYENMQFVSVNEAGEVLAYISYSYSRVSNYAYNFGMITFEDDPVTVGRDAARVIEDIFMKYNFNKLNFGVVVGNPAEEKYDRLVQKYGGRIVGIWHDDVMLSDGKIYDNKVYEIMRLDYIKSRKRGK